MLYVLPLSLSALASVTAPCMVENILKLEVELGSVIVAPSVPV